MDKPNKKISTEKILIDIIKSGLQKQNNEVELLAMTFSRLIRTEDPVISKKIAELVSSYSVSGSFTRGVSLPIDIDSQLEMVTVVGPNKEIYLEPILNQTIKRKVDSFLEERNNLSLLLEKGIKPSTSMLLIGQPGTGKTMLARYIASVLEKDLVILDLSSSISSLLGKTGQNLKKVLQFARQNSSVLLFDEFDAIAKKRDDSTDLGEIKRIVNVLLMELESWPVSSVIIATSNHPELLDRAIWRRFDHVLELGLPGEEERFQILNSQLEEFLSEKESKFLPALVGVLKNKSGADIQRYSENVKRRIILKKEDSLTACIQELESFTDDKKARGKFCALAKEILNDQITIRELSEITGLSVAGVQHHVSKQKNESEG
ncbi:MAG: ATP-binding protein [Candidatus Pacebacteria bacterium]|nr:ATP-binding protein [Candidatus Paceibacterota bacterium]